MLTDVELSWNKELGAWEPCAKCLEIALDAAYSDGFVRPDGDVYTELGDLDGEVELLDEEFDGNADSYVPTPYEQPSKAPWED